MLLFSSIAFSQSLQGVLSIKDALVIYKTGETQKLIALGYEFYCFDYDVDYNVWAKNCDYSEDTHEVVSFGKGTSSLVRLPGSNNDVIITVFNKAAFLKLKGQITALGYKMTDKWGGSSGNSFEVYTKKGSPQITASDESGDNSNMPYNITISK